MEEQFREATVEEQEQWIDANGRPYPEFREAVRKAMLADGWVITRQAGEADCFAKGRVSLYAAPSDGLSDPPLHRIVIFGFPSEAGRIKAEAPPEIDDEDPVMYFEYDLAAALHRANELA